MSGSRVGVEGVGDAVTMVVEAFAVPMGNRTPGASAP